MDKNDKRVFEKLCELTVPALGGEVELPVFSLNYKERWVELLEFWYDNFCDEEWNRGFLYPVLHKIRYEEYPDICYTESQMEIFDLLENEIRTNVKAHRTWVKSAVFERADAASIEAHPNHFSWVHFEFMVDLTDYDIYDAVFKDRKDDKKYWRHVYPKLICRLFPEAVSWCKMDWVLGDCILSGLEEKYNVKYMPGNVDRDDDYGALIMLLKKAWHDGEKLEIGDVLAVKICSEKLASMIWTEDMEEQLVSMFAEAVKLAREGKMKANIVKDSWLYRQAQQWVCDGSLDTDLHKVAAKAVFDAMATLP